MTYVTEENLTDLALERWSRIPDPRLREVMTAFVKHLHAFVREVEPSRGEWATAIDWLTRTGKLCTDKRQEFVLASDVLGVSMLVDAINNRLATGATPTTVEGPFHVHGSPEMADGADMAEGAPGEPCYVVGTVRDTDGRPIAGAVLDVWQTDGEGLYEAQRPEIEGPWMRGAYRTGPDGRFAIRTVAPVGYTIPMDGTVGELMRRTEISHMRPAHIHFHLKARGHHEVVTHLFQRGADHLDSDVVFGVKEALIADFARQPPGGTPLGNREERPFYVVRYDFVLQPEAQAAAAAA